MMIRDYSQVGKAEFLGRSTGKPHVYLEEDGDYSPPKLEWFQIYRGNEEAGKICCVYRIILII